MDGFDSIEGSTNAFGIEETAQNDALSVFTKAWTAKLEVKRAEEYEAEKVTKAKAAEELANWNKQREIRLSSKKDSNRQEEQVLLESLESEVDAPNTWDRVTKLIDTNQPDVPTEKGSESTKVDTGRMKKLFIQLKNEPITSTAN